MRKLMGTKWHMIFNLIYIYSKLLINIIPKNVLIYNDSDTLNLFNSKHIIYFNLTG